MSIKEIIQKLVEKKIGKTQPFYGKVKSVDEAAKTCVVSPLDGGADRLDVRLMATGANGTYLKPAVDSVVAVVMVSDFTGFVAMYSELDSIQLLDGTYGGLVKVQDLVNKINAVEDKVNDILDKLKTHVHGGVTTGPGTTGTTPAFSTVSGLTNTSVPDIENPKITHGNN